MNREQWLNELALTLSKTLFPDRTIPSYRITCGWPSRRASGKTRVLGQCFYENSSKDKVHEIIVSMALDNKMEVAGTLAHEMIHAILGAKVGHKTPFKRIANEIGLTGKMTATVAGDHFIETVSPLLDKLPEYPHAELSLSYLKKQGTRLIKAECLTCGYTARITRKWIELAGTPLCPCNSEPMSIS